MATENHYLLGITVGDYQLEEMVRQTPHGPLFLARHRGEFLAAGPQTFIHSRHLVFSFPRTPGKIGLLNRVLSQTRLLSQQAHLLAANDGNAARN